MIAIEAREAKHQELLAVESEREEKYSVLNATRTAYREALAAAREVSEREHRIEDEYEAMIVEGEPPATPTE